MSSEVVEKGSWLNGKNDWVDVAQFKKILRINCGGVNLNFIQTLALVTSSVH